MVFRSTVPSQVVSYIDQRMPNAREQQESGGPPYKIGIEYDAFVRGALIWSQLSMRGVATTATGRSSSSKERTVSTR